MHKLVQKQPRRDFGGAKNRQSEAPATATVNLGRPAGRGSAQNTEEKEEGERGAALRRTDEDNYKHVRALLTLSLARFNYITAARARRPPT